MISRVVSRLLGRPRGGSRGSGEGAGAALSDSDPIGQELAELREQIAAQQQVIDSHHALLSTLLLSEEARPTGALKLLQDLCLELMSFVHQVCQRHGIDYWLDCGSLLGPVRHGGFIPWDDDLDIAMTRPDYRRFLVALDVEIDRLGIQESVLPTRLRCGADGSRVISGHLQIKCGTAGAMPGMVDVFPYDFVAEVGAQRFDAKAYRRAVRSYRTSLVTREAMDSFVPHAENGGNLCVLGGDMSEVEAASLLEYAAPFGISKDDQPYLVPGLDSVKYLRLVPVDDMFPVAPVAFGDHEFLGPRSPRAYLAGIYGDAYMELPKVVERHTRLHWLRRRADSEELLTTALEVLRDANARF